MSNPDLKSYEIRAKLVTQGDTGSASQVKLSAYEIRPDGTRQPVSGPVFRVKVATTDGFDDATNATIAAATGTGLVTTVTSGKELIVSETVPASATKTLTISGVVEDAETVSIGGRVYEFDTRNTEHITAGRVRVNISAAGSVVKAQGTLRLDTIPTAFDNFVIGGVTYTAVASGAGDAAGEVSIGANLLAFETNLLAAIAGTDGFNTAHPDVTMVAGTHTAASATLTLADVVADTETVTIGNKTYTFQTVLTNVDGNVLIGASAAASLDNLKAAVNLSAGAGTTYATATTAHTQVTATTNTDTTQLFVASVLAASNGNATVQNALASTETLAASGNQFGAATFSGALDKFVITAKAGGTVGNAIPTTETFTATNNTFDAATLGTTTLGVSCSAPHAVTALVAAITGDASAVVTAADGAGDTVVATASSVGTAGNAIAIAETLTNGSWAGAATFLSGGANAASGTALVDVTDASAESFDLLVSGDVPFGGVPAKTFRLAITHAAP